MPRITGGPFRGARAVVAAACLLFWAARPAAGQELDFVREGPGGGVAACTPLSAPSNRNGGAEGPAREEAERQARELGSSAEQALILGDLARAEALLRRAGELSPGSAELAYRHARVLEDLDDGRGAAAGYCRALALAPEEEGFRDAEARLDALLVEEGARVPAAAERAFEEGLSAAERRDFTRAADRFRAASDLAPGWAAAERNLGVALERRGDRRGAATAFLRYLELRPDAPDALAVSRRVGQLQSLALRSGPSPVVAGALGAIVPGMGQLYTGRTRPGLSLMAIAVGTAAAGFLVKEIDVRCLVSVDEGQRCPEAQVVSRDTRRPYLPLAVGAAAVVTLAGAVEAFLEARESRVEGLPRVARGEASPGRPTLTGPSISARGGRVDVSFLGLRLP